MNHTYFYFYVYYLSLHIVIPFSTFICDVFFSFLLSTVQGLVSLWSTVAFKFGQNEEYTFLSERVHAGPWKSDGELNTVLRWQWADYISESDATFWHAPFCVARIAAASYVSLDPTWKGSLTFEAHCWSLRFPIFYTWRSVHILGVSYLSLQGCTESIYNGILLWNASMIHLSFSVWLGDLSG